MDKYTSIHISIDKKTLIFEYRAIHIELPIGSFEDLMTDLQGEDTRHIDETSGIHISGDGETLMFDYGEMYVELPIGSLDGLLLDLREDAGHLGEIVERIKEERG
jgi:hypothetical protein